MADLLSEQIANLDAAVTRYETQLQLGGHVKTGVEVFVVPAASAATDVIRMVRMPVRAHIQSFLTGWDDLDTSTNVTIDIGGHRIVAEGGAAIDADAFTAAAISGQAARAMTETRFSGAGGIASADQPLWEVLGLSAEPEFQWVDLTATLVAGPTTTAGEIVFSIQYSDGN